MYANISLNSTQFFPRRLIRLFRENSSSAIVILIDRCTTEWMDGWMAFNYHQSVMIIFSRLISNSNSQIVVCVCVFYNHVPSLKNPSNQPTHPPAWLSCLLLLFVYIYIWLTIMTMISLFNLFFVRLLLLISNWALVVL